MFRFIIREHLRDDEEIIIKILQLWPLLRVQDVFQDQSVQTKVFSDLLYNIYVMEAVDVDPGHGGLICIRKTLVD